MDWFGNVGDIMANISNLGSDALAMQYGYIMNEHVNVHTMSATYVDYVYGAGHPCNLEHVTKHARRLQASPYGFNVSFSGLTARQDAIVVALGISRSHR